MIRLTEEETARGAALACQTLVAGDVTVWIPPQKERLERLERGDRAERAAPEVVLCDRHHAPPWVAALEIVVPPATMDDQTPDLERLQRELARQHGMRFVRPTFQALKSLPGALREGDWTVTALVESDDADGHEGSARLLDVLPGRRRNPVLGVAIDVGTTTIAAYLSDLETGRLLDHASAYNEQIQCGEDVVSRIIYGRQPARREELRQRVVTTINALLDEMLQHRGADAHHVVRAVVAGNTTMVHLLLGVPADHIRLEPYVPAVGRVPLLTAAQLDLHLHPEAMVDCLPDVGAYVGGDITSGVLRTGLHEQDAVTLFIDVGTNGEIVLGNSEWLISCACSAGPAFEGAGADSGMRAVPGAVEEVWIDQRTLEPSLTVIGDERPLGICGSGMISLLGEMLVTGIIDKSGRMTDLERSPRMRRGQRGAEYVVAWAAETGGGKRDLVLTETDIQNLLRAKAAIYAGVSVLCESVGLTMADVERVLIGGAFGRHIDIEKAIQIGLLPDLPWERFSYLGNTSVQGAFLALTCREHRRQVDDLAAKMTYLELSADNRFMEAFTSALFIPHTDETLFPSVVAARSQSQGGQAS